jgi:predicted oxidoreductase
VKSLTLGNSNLQVSTIALGCMRMSNLSHVEAERIIQNALDLGINFFDHADIYGSGQSEEVFSKSIDMNSTIREKMVIQTKAGIRKGYYDFSKEHIIQSVEGSLKRLKTDYIDVFLLHRPDALMEPEEVAEAFTELEESGKVRHFGVSNHNSMQIELLKKYVEQDLIVNQLQFGIMHTGMIDSGLLVNMKHDNNRDSSLLEYCRLNDITIQAWSPFQYGFFEGVFIDNDKFPEVNETLQRIGEKYHISKTSVAIAWILRHPAKIQPLIGTMNPGRLAEIAKASDVVLSREEWYEIYLAAGNLLP